MAFPLAQMMVLVCLGADQHIFANLCKQGSPLLLHGAENRALDISSYKTTQEASRVVCGRNCHADKRCQSFNYYRDSRLCELKSSSRAQHPRDFIEVPGSVYFDADDHTPQFSLRSSPRLGGCQQLLEAGYEKSGVYTIYPAFSDGLKVYCDMESDGGGWIVIQRRQDGSENFNRNWTDYETGFGNLTGEFWLGNAVLQNLTLSGGPWKLRFNLEGWDGNRTWSEYSPILVVGPKYQLNYDSFNTNSTAGDSLRPRKSFTTEDRDNDNHRDNCAVMFGGGWWFDGCGYSNLNGQYHKIVTSKGHKPLGETSWVMWARWRVFQYSMKSCTMKLRP